MERAKVREFPAFLGRVFPRTALCEDVGIELQVASGHRVGEEVFVLPHDDVSSADGKRRRMETRALDHDGVNDRLLMADSRACTAQQEGRNQCSAERATLHPAAERGPPAHL